MRRLCFLLFGRLILGECPPGWTRRGDTAYCYNSFEDKDVTWNTAQSTCISYGADLVWFENKSEMEWVYNNILNWDTHAKAWRYYWIGLNDLKQVSRLEWANSHDDERSTKFQNFGADNEMDPSRRCTFALFSNNLPQDYGHEGKWYKEKCEKTKGLKFVCKMNEDWFVKECPDGWYAVDWGYNGRMCLGFSTWNRPFDEAEQVCKDDGANLVQILNEQQQLSFDAWFGPMVDRHYEGHPDDENNGFWIGLTDKYSDPRNYQMEWLYQPGALSYDNWVYGEPAQGQQQWPGNTCTKVLNGDGTPSWVTDRCAQNRGSICQKEVGTSCPDGWTFIPPENFDGMSSGDGKCVQTWLGGGSHKPWYNSYQFCESIGAKMLLIENQKEQDFLSQYFDQWSRAGVTRIWLRISDVLTGENCQWSDYISFTQWIGGEQPQCFEDHSNCAYMGTSATANNWGLDYCSKEEAFACETKPGQQIHAIQKPVNDQHCPETPNNKIATWQLYPEGRSCFLIGKRTVDDSKNAWMNNTDSANYCAQQRGKLPSIGDEKENSFLASRILNNSWLGMKFTKSGTVPQTWQDGNPVTYQNWKKDEPKDDPDYMCPIMIVSSDTNYGMWKLNQCDLDGTSKLVVCKRSSMNGPITPPPEIPDVEPHVDCEPGWTLLPETNNCYYIDVHDRAWNIAEDNCLSMNAHLVSINSPDVQTRIFQLTSKSAASVKCSVKKRRSKREQ